MSALGGGARPGRRFYALALSVWLCAWASAAIAQDTQVYARVIVDTAPVRSGPSATQRVVTMARRDQVFPVRGRATRGHYFRIELPDGTHGYVQGDLVYNHEVSEERAHGGRFWPEVFAPAALPSAHGEVALVGGALGGGGMLALRPTWLLQPSFGLEITAGAAVAPGGRLLMLMLGPVVNLFPSSPVVPFATVAAGVVTSSPNADTFLLEQGSVSAASAGLGLRIGFRHRITLRLEARTYVLFDADRYVRQEEWSGGLTVFF